VPEQRERWERGVARVGSPNSLGEAVGQIYVQRHFPESSKLQMQDLVENLRAALRQSIEENDWMGPLTKEEAYLKLESFRPKIAYPDVWEDLSAIEIARDSLFENARNVREFRYQEEIARIGQPTDREEWGMTPQTVNAYYRSSFNEIVFPRSFDFEGRNPLDFWRTLRDEYADCITIEDDGVEIKLHYRDACELQTKTREE